MRSFHKNFFENIANIQYTEVCVAMLNFKNNDIENLLYDTTFEVIVEIMTLIDGYGSFNNEKMDIINCSTGIGLKQNPFIELHDCVCDYIKYEKNQSRNQIETDSIKRYNPYQHKFFTYIADMQDKQVQSVFAEYKSGDDIEKMLYKITDNVIVEFVKMLNGQSSFGNDKLDIVDCRTGIGLKQSLNIELYGLYNSALL